MLHSPVTASADVLGVMRESETAKAASTELRDANIDSDCASDRGREEQVLFERKDTSSD